MTSRSKSFFCTRRVGSSPFLSSRMSISDTSLRRLGHSPVWMQTMQRTISAMPCSSSNSPAIGMAILTGQIGGFQGVPVPSDCWNELQAISEPTQTSAPT